MSRLTERAAELPAEPGVYLFKDRKGRVLYVGKAINLRARVRQYLAGHDERVMVPFLVRHAADVDCVVTRTEKEALLLENSLIKKHRPRFNAKLRDDANFLHLRIDPTSSWPRYHLVRQIKADGARYYGPYASAQKARHTLTQLQRLFPLRTCTDHVLRTRKRPCLLHQMGRCVAPCVDLADATEYARLVDESGAFLQGRTGEVVAGLGRRMRAAADVEAFEEAARLRDLITSIQDTTERQQVVDPKLADRDVWGLHRDGASVGLALVPVRAGFMQEPLGQVVRGVVEPDEDLLSSALNAAYPEGTDIPGEILVPVLPTAAEALAEILGERRGRKVVLRAPQRGDKTRLVELAARNARVRLETDTDASARREDTLAALARVVGLNKAPRRMECFDNSHLSGTNPVAAMAVFIDGEPARAEYRRYRIKTAAGGDDYAGMREILTRRFTRGIAEGNLPDLLVVDGGKGQLGVALAVLSDLGLSHQAVVGFAKPRTEHARGERDAADKIVLPNVKDPIRLPAHHPALRLLQHLRDATHNHAVRYQRKVRTAATLSSVLEELPGVGPTRRRALLKHFGSVKAVVRASADELASVPGVGPATAGRIQRAVQGAAAKAAARRRPRGSRGQAAEKG
jgi:excinuclease ABC subunit C